MAFVAGAIIGGLIGAAIVRAYDWGQLRNLQKQVDGTMVAQSRAINLQKTIINTLRVKLKIYETRYGKLDEEESECN